MTVLFIQYDSAYLNHIWNTKKETESRFVGCRLNVSATFTVLSAYFVRVSRGGSNIYLDQPQTVARPDMPDTQHAPTGADG